jgi:AmpD protein
MDTGKLNLKIDPLSSLLMDTPYVASANCDERPDPEDISLIVIHGISLPPGEFGGPEIEQLFTNSLDHQQHPYFEQIRDLHVSSHLLIRRDGRAIQFVPFEKRAWHAGPSHYEGRERCNDFSIGIELEGTDEIAYTDKQYQQLAAIIEAILQAFPRTSRDRIVGHADIAPGRKTDPGPAFDWAKLAHVLAARLG